MCNIPIRALDGKNDLDLTVLFVASIQSLETYLLNSVASVGHGYVILFSLFLSYVHGALLDGNFLASTPTQTLTPLFLTTAAWSA